MPTLYTKEVKIKNPVPDFTNAEVKATYMKTEKPKKTSLCPLINEDGICVPSLDTPRNSKGEITPFYCWSIWYLGCGIFTKTYGGLTVDSKD